MVKNNPSSSKKAGSKKVQKKNLSENKSDSKKSTNKKPIRKKSSVKKPLNANLNKKNELINNNSASKNIEKSEDNKNIKNTLSFKKKLFFSFLIIILLIGIFLIAYNYYTNTYLKEKELNAPLVKVGDMLITNNDLETQYNLLPPQFKQLFSKDQVLQQLINEDIIILYAKKEGVVVSDDDVNEEINNIVNQSNMSLQKLEENIEKNNLTINDFKELIKRKLYLQKGYDLLFKDLNISDKDVKDFYDNNEELFYTKPQVKVRHILIRNQITNASSLAKELLERVNNGEDFCKLVKEYSDDKGSINNCGTYTFSKGQMVPAFEEASFSLKPNQTTIVNTQFGFHVLQKLEDIPKRKLSFDEVKEKIKAYLFQQEKNKIMQDLFNKMKSEVVWFNKDNKNKE